MEEIKYIPGDLVLVKESVNKITNENTVMEVTEADINGFVVVSKIYESDLCQKVRAKDIVPIILTTDILKKNGWEEDRFMDNVYHKIDCSCLKLLDSPYYAGFSVSYGRESMSFDIIYCHQLQHLLFGLGLDSNLKV